MKNKPKIKTYVLTVSNYFPAYHKRAGQPTNFIEKIRSGEKIHTIRGNYELWKKRFEKIERGEAVLSIRSWSGTAYRSKQIEHFILTAESGIGIQHLVYNYFFSIGNGKKPISVLLAHHDGLGYNDFINWFPSIGCREMVIIHFTKFRY